MPRTPSRPKPTAGDAARVRAYVASQTPVAGKALRQIRTAIRVAAPGGVDVISYGIPAVRLDGKILVWYAAWKAHESLYPIGPALARTNARDRYQTAKGTIRFPLDQPLPSGLVTRLVRARLAELRTRARR